MKRWIVIGWLVLGSGCAADAASPSIGAMVGACLDREIPVYLASSDVELSSSGERIASGITGPSGSNSYELWLTRYLYEFDTSLDPDCQNQEACTQEQAMVICQSVCSSAFAQDTSDDVRLQCFSDCEIMIDGCFL
jgi:hypothetical protein